MRTIILSLGLVMTCLAQTTLTPTSAQTTARPGNTITVSVNAAGTTNTGLAAVQWMLNTPANYTKVASLGTTSTAASKKITCDVNNVSCVIYGLGLGPNTNIIANGQLASYVVTVPATATAGAISITVSGIVGTNVATTPPVVTNPGTPLSILILAKTDVDGNGITNDADILAMVAQVLVGPCTNDQNGDGVCDVRDVQLVANASTGN